MSTGEAQLQSAAAQGATTELSDFSSLLQKEFKPKSDRAKDFLSKLITN